MKFNAKIRVLYMLKKSILAVLIPAIMFLAGCDDNQKDKAAELRAKADDKASELSDSAKEKWDETKDKAAELKVKADDKVTEISNKK